MSEHKEYAEELQDDFKNYMVDREKVKSVLGRIGGMPGRTSKVVNTLLVVLVAVCFLWAILTHDLSELPLEVAVLLVSLKLMLLLHQNAKINHFQFWMLSSLEWRLNELTSEIRAAAKRRDKDEDNPDQRP